MKNYGITCKLTSPKEFRFKGIEEAVLVKNITINEPTKLVSVMFQPISKMYYEYILDMQKQFMANGFKQEDVKKEETPQEKQDRLIKEAQKSSKVSDIDDEKTNGISREDDIQGKLAFVMSLNESQYKTCDEIFVNILCKLSYCNDSPQLVLEKELLDQLYMKDYKQILGEFLVSFLE